MQKCANCGKDYKGTKKSEARRVEKFGSQEEVNKKWKCRKCRKPVDANTGDKTNV